MDAATPEFHPAPEPDPDPPPAPHPEQQPEQPQPPELVRHDRLAVAVGNASLLGVGYLLLGRWAWAVLTTLVTITFAVLLATVVPGVWFEILFLVWWAALIGHGWYLAGVPARPAPVRWPRAIALLVAIPVLAGIGYVRYDSAVIDNRIAEGRADGDCDKAQSAVDGIWSGHYVVNGPMAIRGEQTTQACGRLRSTQTSLDIAAAERDVDGLRAGYQELGAVRTDLPGHDRMVSTVLDGFLDSLPGRDPCTIAEVTDWMRTRPGTGDLLERSAAVVPKIAPAALVACGDSMAKGNDWNTAKARYQQVLDQYPGHELTAKAQEGVKQATQRIELQHILALNSRYCDTPAKYSAAAPYTKGTTNRGLVYQTGSSRNPHIKQLPDEWEADVPQAVLVVCVGQKTAGAAVRTCRYRDLPGLGPIRSVTFSKMLFPVKAYELRTGSLVIDTQVEVNGAVCPPTLTRYTNQVQLNEDVNPSDADIRNAFAPIFTQ